MHTANLSDLRFALLDHYQHEDSDEIQDTFARNRKVNPHIFEHEARAAELREDDDEDAAWIHELLGRNMRRAAHHPN